MRARLVRIRPAREQHLHHFVAAILNGASVDAAVARLLLKHGAVLDQIDEDGKTALDWARRWNNMPVIEALEEAYAEGSILALSQGHIPGEIGEMVASFIYPNSAERGRKKFQKKQDAYQERYQKNLDLTERSQKKQRLSSTT